MSIWSLVAKEILHSKLNVAFFVLAVAMAIASLGGAMTLLKVHDIHTQELLTAKHAEAQERRAQLEDDMRKAMLGLGFNIVILSKDQKLEDWYAQDYAANYLPEQYAERLARSKTVTVQHLFPTLQERVLWPEKKRTIILVGSRGELADGGGKKPLMPVVPAGKIILGHELHENLALNAGDKLTLLGRQFTVDRCYPMRGNKDDITAWIDLPAAQELLNKKGQINAILALECQCAFANLPKVRQEIAQILPNTQVIERGSQALARAEARNKVAEEAEAALGREEAERSQLRQQRESLASILVPLVMTAAVVWIGLLARDNVRRRRGEIAILRAVGVRGRQILLLLLSKAILIGLVGGAIGLVAGYWAGISLSARLEAGGTAALSLAGLLRPAEIVLAFALAPLLAAAGSWLPAMLAVRQDPAVVLREE